METYSTTTNFVNFQITNWLVDRSRILNSFLIIFFDESLMFEVVLYQLHVNVRPFIMNYLLQLLLFSWCFTCPDDSCHSWRETLSGHWQFPSPLDVVMKEPLFTFLGSWGTPGPCTLETDRTEREIQSHSCRWLNFGPQMHWYLSLPVIGIDPLVHFEPFVLRA